MSLLKNFFGASPHSSIVIDLYKQNVPDCRKSPGEKVLFGITGCEMCLQDAVAALIATDPKFAAFLRGAYEKAHKPLKDGYTNPTETDTRSRFTAVDGIGGTPAELPTGAEK